MAEKSDEEMAHAPPVVDEEKERKKALLVYKSNQHSASDDDEEEEAEEGEEQDQEQNRDQEIRHEEARTRVEEQDDDDEEADARSVRSETGSVEEEEEQDDDEDDEEDLEEDLEDEEDHVRVEKDDDESVNAPSDDDLDSTATPRHDTEEEDEEEEDDVAGLEEDTEDSATESKSSQPLAEQAERALTSGGAGNKLAVSTGGAPSSSYSSSAAAASGSKLNVEEIIAARRRTGARKECEVCHEARNGRRAMLCANCKTMYHSSCYRKKYSKLISAMGKQWFCPDCEPVKQAAEMAAYEMGGGADNATPRSKKKGVAASLYAPYDDLPRQLHGKLSGKDTGKSNSARGKSMVKNQRDGGGMSSTLGVSSSAAALALMATGAGGSTGNGSGGGLAGVASASLVDQELKRVTEIAMRSSRKVSALILERASEMLHVAQSMAGEIEDVLGSQLHQSTTKNAALPPARSILHHDEASSGTGPLPPLSALTMVSSSAMADSGRNGHGNGTGHATDMGLLRSLHDGLFSLKNMLEQLQVMGIQSEMDLVRDIKMPPVKDDAKTSGASGHGASATTASGNAGSSGHGTSSTRKSGSGAAAARTAAALSAAAKREAKPGASRLYSAEQIRKLEDWYQKSSRPESSEIQSMYRIINSPDYADKELQPDGISVKQIRIWFDNRRAKERLDYMRLKMKDISTADMDADDVKRMKAAYIDEAKEVLEARVSRLKENGKSVPLIDAADTLLLQSSERPLPLGKGSKASPASKMGGGGGAGGGSFASSSSSHQKKRVRIDYVASVRKAVKEARDAGKNEDEIRLVKVAAIERARERLHVPYKNARLGPTKPLGKEEVTHVKMSMLKLLEEDAPAEELTDIIELLLSVVIPRDTLVESQLHRQLNLVLKAHKDNKELVKQTNKLLDEFNTIIEKGDDDDTALYDDELQSLSGGGSSSATGGAAGGSSSSGMGLLLGSDDYDKSSGLSKSKKKTKAKDATNLLLSVDSESLPGTPGASPDSPSASPDARKARVKFSRDQLMKLERHFHKEDTPSKKNLETLSKKLNEIAARDAACDGQDRIDYKQIRSWFYKRRSTNQPPQALSQADLKEIEASGPASSSSSASETESDSNDESAAPTMAATAAAARSSGKANGKSTSKDKSTAAKAKRKASDDKPATSSSNKRQKKSSDAAAPVAAASDTKAPSRGSSKKDSAATSATNTETGGKQHYGRIFNVKQLATIIEAYEKNPRPSVERLEELQKILNQDDHADDHFVNPLGVTKRQIKTWFSNRRAKERLEVIRMKVQTPGESGSKPKSSSLSGSSASAAATLHAESGSEEDLHDDEMGDPDTPRTKSASKSKSSKVTTTPAAPGSSAKKELFSQDAAASRAVSDDDDVSDEDLSDDDDDDDDDVDMGSDDEDDDAGATNAQGDSDDENGSSSSSSSSSSDDDDDDDDDVDDRED